VKAILNLLLLWFDLQQRPNGRSPNQLTDGQDFGWEFHNKTTTYMSMFWCHVKKLKDAVFVWLDDVPNHILQQASVCVFAGVYRKVWSFHYLQSITVCSDYCNVPVVY